MWESVTQLHENKSTFHIFTFFRRVLGRIIGQRIVDIFVQWDKKQY
jgi:hypothetical protein